MQGVDNLIVFQKSIILAMEIFSLSKGFPAEERFALTDQIRRSSRSVSANLAEAYRKRRYELHFISKLTDADMENSETQVWLMYCLKCQYITISDYKRLIAFSEEVGKLINHMIYHPEKYARRTG
jgi:four helix bundle protein